MNLILNSISKDYAGHQVLDKISFSIGERECIGLIGENGSGKTTLLRIVAGLDKPDSGSVQIIPDEAVIGYIPQAPEEIGDKSVREFLGDSLNLEADEMYKVDIGLAEIGMSDLAEKAVSQLSSGQRTKGYLARLLVEKPTLLLLDEPTNHLDLEALDWLEKYLADYEGSVLVVSHDRRFLDNLVDKIIELDQGKIKTYGGNYSFYRRQKQIEKEAYERQYLIQEKKIARTKEVINEISNRAQSIENETIDFYWLKRAAKVARKAVNQRRKLERFLESEEKLEKPEPDFELSAIFKPRRESSKTVVYLKDISKVFGGQRVLHDFNLLINREKRVALLGANGSGKTTLLNIILGQLKPDSGIVEIGNAVEIGYLPQEQHDVNSTSSLLEYLEMEVNLDRTFAYKLAHRFLFSDADLRTSVKDLSSGQKSRLALAKIMASGANFIILDEPTNHLDIPSREALEKAILAYPGTLLVVSHDRYFLDMINPERIISL